MQSGHNVNKAVVQAHVLAGSRAWIRRSGQLRTCTGRASGKKGSRKRMNVGSHILGDVARAFCPYANKGASWGPKSINDVQNGI